MAEPPPPPSLPVEILAKVFPFLRDDPHSYYNLALANHQVHHISQSLGGPRKWPDALVNWENTAEDYYVHQVKYSPDGLHIALMLRVYEDKDSVVYHRLVRILDIDKVTTHQESSSSAEPLVEIPVGRSTPFSGYCGHYFVTVEPRRVRVFDQRLNYQQIQELPTVDLIVGVQMYDANRLPKIALQTAIVDNNHQDNNNNNNNPQQLCSLTVWSLVECEFVREIPYTGAENFAISEDDRVFACVDRGEDGRSITTIFLQKNDDDNYDDNHHHYRTYELDLPANVRRGWIDTCKFSPDGQRLAVLTDEYIFQLLDTSVEPPVWIDQGYQWRAPDGCTFSGQMQYTPDSRYLVAHARTPWNTVYQLDDHLNTIQIWDAQTLALKATKEFHDLVGSVGLSPDGKFVLVIQGDGAADLFRSATSPTRRIWTRYIAAMNDYSPYPQTGEDSF